MQDGLGGANSLAAVRDYEETIRAEAWDAAGTALGEVRKRTRWIRTPGLLRLDQIGPRGTYVLYFDGAARSGWTKVSGVRFPTRRVSFHSGVKRGEVTTEAVHVNVGLRPRDLAAKPADFAPDISRR